MTDPVVTLLTDYGCRDEFVGVCHGVIARICPQARVIDLGHGIPRHDVRAGAVILAGALPYLPAGVHVGIVDPDVGGRRRAVALAAGDGRLLVGPDNGLLLPAAEAAGGIVQAVEISHSPWRLEPVSATFHGRDIFAPVAAHLAAGRPLAEAGPPLDPAELLSLQLPVARVEAGRLRVAVTYIDGFGNVQLSATHDDGERAGLQLGHEAELQLEDRPAAPARVRFVRTFAEGDTGELILYEDASRRLALAVSQGSAVERLSLAVDQQLVITVR